LSSLALRCRVAHIHSSLDFKESLDLSNLTHEIGRLQRATASLDIEKEAALKRLAKLTHPRKGKLPFPLPAQWPKIRAVLEEIKGINAKIRSFEQGFIGEGLKDREWYKHVGTAPYVSALIHSLSEINAHTLSPRLQWQVARIRASACLRSRPPLICCVDPPCSHAQGATTFPSITEALTLDRDVAAAQVEADKVALLLKAMAKRLEA
jgi:hypothetical protein